PELAGDGAIGDPTVAESMDSHDVLSAETCCQGPLRVQANTAMVPAGLRSGKGAEHFVSPKR
ncbi:MAG: hypothetical protein AAF628_37215, partial [Planctomycetota bacterium]